MQLESGKISIFIGQDGTTIEVKDDTANITFARIKLTPDQLSQALSRLALTPCEINVCGLEKVGKTHEHKSFEFEITEKILESEYHSDFKEQIVDYAHKVCPKGWTASGYFDSQDSFFTKDGKKWARTTIRRWV